VDDGDARDGHRLVATGEEDQARSLPAGAVRHYGITPEILHNALEEIKALVAEEVKS
jgi:hypothetical protein